MNRVLNKVVLGFTALTLLSSISACSNNTPITHRTVFKTKITDSGLKHFEISNANAGYAIQNQRSRTTNLSSESRRATARKLTNNQLHKGAELHIASNQYCRTGYWVIEDNVYTSKRYVRGECNEVASNEDKQKFPDTITFW